MVKRWERRISKRRVRKSDEQVEQYIDFLVDEGYDCSELTWEDMCEEYESLDEGLRSAVKRLLGKKDAPAEKKPESRGEQLRKKYNVGPERSDTSAKRQIPTAPVQEQREIREIMVVLDTPSLLLTNQKQHMTVI